MGYETDGPAAVRPASGCDWRRDAATTPHPLGRAGEGEGLLCLQLEGGSYRDRKNPGRDSYRPRVREIRNEAKLTERPKSAQPHELARTKHGFNRNWGGGFYLDGDTARLAPPPSIRCPQPTTTMALTAPRSGKLTARRTKRCESEAAGRAVQSWIEEENARSRSKRVSRLEMDNCNKSRASGALSPQSAISLKQTRRAQSARQRRSASVLPGQGDRAWDVPRHERAVATLGTKPLIDTSTRSSRARVGYHQSPGSVALGPGDSYRRHGGRKNEQTSDGFC